MSKSLQEARIVDARLSAARVVVSGIVAQGVSLSALALALAIFEAAERPDVSPTAVGALIFERLTTDIPGSAETLAKYRSEMANAVSFARAQKIIPAWDAGAVSDADKWRLVDDFTGKGHTLRAMSAHISGARSDKAKATAATKAAQDAASRLAFAQKVEADKVAAAKAEKAARKEAGVSTKADFDVATIVASLGALQSAALAGDENARNFLAFVTARLMDTRTEYEAADIAAIEMQQAA